uniref:Protein DETOXIFICATION n=1 Tax=Araucaria cunninghamii TaxID=56994 RepID=A0A0D6R6A9_ARACU
MEANPVPAMERPLLEHHHCEGESGSWAFFGLDMEEVKMQMKIAVPMIITNVCQYGVNVVSVMFAGHMGEHELAGAALANSWALVTGYVVIIGMTGALETLCGQAYGAKEYLMLGVYLQASMFVTSVCAFLLTIFWLYSEPILIFIGQDADLCAMATMYLMCLIPGLYAQALLHSLTRFLQTQSVVIPLTMCAICPLILHFFLCYLLVHHTRLGFRGAALANSITLWLMVLCLILYMKLARSCQNTWGGFSPKAFKVVGPFLRLGIQSAVMVCLEYWAFEFLVLVAGLLPDSGMNTSLVAICVNTEALAYMVTFGFSAAVSTRVSNELGAGHLHKAKSAVALTLKFAVLLAATIAVLLLIGCNTWAAAFSDSWRIKENFAAMTPLLATSIFFDAIQGVLSGFMDRISLRHLKSDMHPIIYYTFLYQLE